VLDNSTGWLSIMKADRFATMYEPA
jgi:hypothetical protein